MVLCNDDRSGQELVCKQRAFLQPEGKIASDDGYHHRSKYKEGEIEDIFENESTYAPTCYYCSFSVHSQHSPSVE